jgi:hypothetical protein
MTVRRLHQHGRTVTSAAVHPIVWAIRTRDAFRSDALAGHDSPNGTGRLPAEHVAGFRSDDPTYVVYSYATPIAWHGRRGWIVPDESYSHTTTRHQRFVRLALS